MAREIYPESVFKEQSNGQVFYKEGKLNDPLMGEPMEGIFQSWKYSWDSGKQVFKASDTEKVYEKRLIKDKYGNPHWSGWMEIVPGEANGIQAIAINNQPLQLPNNDGAIKLQITPQMIDTYTRREIYDLITSKIDQSYSSTYEYVNWIDGCANAIEVLEQTYGQEGGEMNKYYLVEPEPVSGKASKAKYYIWAPRKDGTYCWLEVDTPDMKSFVSYSAFNEHQFDKILHTSQEDRDRWDEKVTHAELENALTGSADVASHSLELVNQHIADVGEVTSPHISTEERMRLNSLFQNVQDMPDNSSRYVVENGTYALAYEQTQQSKSTEEVVVKDMAQAAYVDGDVIVNIADGLRTQFNSITSENNIIEDFIIKFSNVAIMGENNRWYIETDTGYVSETYDRTKTFVEIHPSFAVIPNVVTLKMTNRENGRITVNNIQVVIKKKAKLGVDIGDPAKKLTVNLVGPEDAIPTYNGVPLTELTVDASETAKWGKITGDINHQVDLDKKIANAIARKINYADLESHLRWDVYRDGVIKSVIQQVNNNEEVVEKITVENKSYRKGETLINNIKAKMQELKNQGYVMYACRFVAENISVYQNEDKEPLPVYFKTNNNAIPASPTVVGAFVWDWPGSLFDEFDRITIEGNSAEYITNAYLEVKCIKYGDVEIGLFNELSNEYYSIAIKADELANEVNNFVSRSKENASIFAEKVATIAGDEKTVIGAREYNYDDEKEEGTIEVYGQEIDERYASRAKFEEVAAMADKHEADVAAMADKHEADIAAMAAQRDTDAAEEETYRANVEDKFSQLDEKIEISNSQNQELVNGVLDAANGVQANLDAAKEEFENKDLELEGRIDSNAADIDELEGDLANVKEEYLKKSEYKKSEQLTQETFDLIVNDSDELNQFITDGSLEKAKRILFKTGSYEIYTENTAHAISFDSVAYVKGETPCSIKNVADNQAKPVNYENTKFEGIDICLGHGQDVVKIDAEGRREIDVGEVAGDFTLALNDYAEVYKLIVVDDTEITLANPLNNKKYSIYIDQGDEVKNVKFTNFMTNCDNEFVNGLENQKPNCRTVVNVVSDEGTSKDSYIVSEVIYGLAAIPDAAAQIPVIIRKAKAKLLDSSEMAIATNYSEDDVIGSYMPGNVFTFNPEILAGFAHNPNGADYKVVTSTGFDVGEGNCFEDSKFKVPTNLREGDAVYIDFYLKPQVATIKLDPAYEQYVVKNTMRGFKAVAAGYQASISFAMDEKFELYGITTSEPGIKYDLYQGSLPWNFTVPTKSTFEDFEIVIKPLFYAMFDTIEMEVVNNAYRFDTSKVALVGNNVFDIKPGVSNEIVNDPNFGNLYTLPPIALVEKEEYTGHVDEILNGRDYEAYINFPESGTTAEVELKVAGIEDNFIFPFFVAEINNASQGESLDTPAVEKNEDGSFTINTFVGENRRYKFSISFEGQAVNDYSGTWKSNNNNVVIYQGNDNTVEVIANTKGSAVITFTSNFTGLDYSIKLNVVTHAKKVVGEHVYTNANTDIIPEVVFYDFNNNEVSPATISDISGTFEAGPDATSKKYINDDAGSHLVITNDPFPEGTVTVNAQYKFVPTDSECESELSDMTIHPAKYLVSWTVADENIKSVTLYEGTNRIDKNCNATGGTILKMNITLEDGVKFNNVAALEEVFSNVNVLANVGGQFIASLRMPHDNVTFTL